MIVSRMTQPSDHMSYLLERPCAGPGVETSGGSYMVVVYLMLVGGRSSVATLWQALDVMYCIVIVGHYYYYTTAVIVIVGYYYKYITCSVIITVIVLTLTL